MELKNQNNDTNSLVYTIWNNNLRGVVRRNRENIGGTMRKKEIGSRFKYSVGICAFKSNSKSPTSGGFY